MHIVIVILEPHHFSYCDVMQLTKNVVDPSVAIRFIAACSDVVGVGSVDRILVCGAHKSARGILFANVLSQWNEGVPTVFAFAAIKDKFSLLWSSRRKFSLNPDGYVAGYRGERKILRRRSIMVKGIHVLIIILSPVKFIEGSGFFRRIVRYPPESVLTQVIIGLEIPIVGHRAAFRVDHRIVKSVSVTDFYSLNALFGLRPYAIEEIMIPG